MNVPILNSTGKFILKHPFVTRSNVNYTVTAIREFSDIYPKNVDVYEAYYKPVGLINGATVNGKIFNFDEEVKSKPAIVTLEGADDSVVYVPTTYIESFPVFANLNYSRLMLTADLGALPDMLPIDSILSDVEDLISTRFGINAQVKVVRAFSDRQPTSAEHELLEQSRLGNIKNSSNHYSQNLNLKEALKNANKKIEAMTKILVENQLI